MASAFPGRVSDTTALVSESGHDNPQASLYGSPNQARPSAAEDQSPGRHRVALVLLAAGLVVGSFTQSFDLAFLVSNYNKLIASDLDNLGNAVWVVLAGSISESASQPLYSHISLSRGVQLPLLTAVWLCAQGFLSCSLSTNIWALALSRAIVGLGKSGLSLLTVLVISDLVGVTDIPLWRSGVLVAGTLAEISGGPLGSSIATRFGWRATFGAEYVIMLASCALVTASIILIRSAPIGLLLPPLPSLRQRPFDALGAVTLLLAVVTPLMAISLGGEILSWTHPLEIILLCISPILLALFCWVESKAALPIIPMGLVSNGNALTVIVSAAGVVFAYNSVIFNLSLYMDVQGADKLKDWALSVIFAASPFGAVLAGIVIKKTKRLKKLLIINMAVLATVYSMLALTSITTGTTTYIALLAVVGFAMGIVENCLITALFLAVDKIDQPPMYATFDLILAFVADIAITVSTALMRSMVRLRLSNDPAVTEEVIRKSLESLNYARLLPSELKSKIFDAFAGSIRSDYSLASGLILLSLLGALKLRDAEG
ncbi:hypothetical protein MAPG_03760 [Magnaporthiopsis poae ATCC 64411]|uniref:Major facilitator superfamily (MFS) profile domain-containing protein n=1 Tax=Magnaporthiopsis poae (strain ATCC 64411 / 73-15) TaxID=644358 RepID=A0A0C4DUW5_MAGP6|nr:hypothetical protein MAPG_03760 [Magnaporthiopsis poae ATCC 64411]